MTEGALELTGKDPRITSGSIPNPIAPVLPFRDDLVVGVPKLGIDGRVQASIPIEHITDSSQPRLVLFLGG